MKNWKTSFTGIGAAVTSTLTGLAALPYSLGDVATIIPVEWKTRIFVIGAIATLVLKSLNSLAQKDANPTNGT